MGGMQQLPNEYESVMADMTSPPLMSTSMVASTSSASSSSAAMLSLLIHIPFLLILHYAWNNIPISPHSLAQFGGRFRFLTLQNLFILYLYTIFTILSTLISIPNSIHVSPWQHRVQNLSNTIRTSIIHPLWVISMIVMLGYYLLIHNDPELIKSAAHHPHFFIHMHIQHMIGPILLTIDMAMISVFRRRSTSRSDFRFDSNAFRTTWTMDLGILYLYATFYTIFSLACVYANKAWIYPFQVSMNVYQHVAFYSVNYIAGTGLLWICRMMRDAMDRMAGDIDKEEDHARKNVDTAIGTDHTKNAKVE